MAMTNDLKVFIQKFIDERIKSFSTDVSIQITAATPSLAITEYDFESSTVWTVTHNLGRRPIIAAYTGVSAGIQEFGSQLFGTSYFGGSLTGFTGEITNHEATSIKEANINQIEITWPEAREGYVVVI